MMGVLDVYLFMVFLAVSQAQLFSGHSAPVVGFGNCDYFNLALLGNWNALSTSGLVPMQLLENYQSRTSLTGVLPNVKIGAAVTTCISLGDFRGTYSTVVVAVEYNCSGIACFDNSPGLINYTSQFLFHCHQTSDTYISTGFIKDSPEYDSISLFATVTDGSCALCSIFDWQSDFNPRGMMLFEAQCIDGMLIINASHIWL